MPIPAKDVSDVIDTLRSVTQWCPGWLTVERVIRDYLNGTLEGTLRYVNNAGADETHYIQVPLDALADITPEVLDALAEQAFARIADRMSAL